jgi:glycosyltransferase involved in cell wall biosynthesis
LKMGQPEISIVIPVYNSSDCMLALYEAICKTCNEFESWELILVNDKSSDQSWDRIVYLCSINPKVKGISFRRNFGQDNAILAGLRLSRGAYVVVMDDDLQHAPSDIVKLYDQCKKGYDVCYGFFTEKKQKPWKNAGSWLNGKVSEKLLNKPGEIYLSPFKIISRNLVNEVIQNTSPYTYLDATILNLTSSLTQIEVQHHERVSGNGNYTFLKSFVVFLNHITSYSVYPLRLVTVTGFSAAIVSFIAAAFYLVQYLYADKRVEGWITLLLMLIFFGGLILMSIGLIGVYVGRIFLSVNNKPQYSIDALAGFDPIQSNK